MSQDQQQDERTELPIERGFPIERVNEIAQKEGRAKMYYRPIYTMHKWWARRLGCVFRTISLYTLLDNPENIEAFEPGQNNETLADWGDETEADIGSLLARVDMSDPESLWKLYNKDVRVENKRILDPFMGGGTSLVEASRLGADVVGNDINPVAWFVSKKQLEAGKTDIRKLEEAFEQVKQDVADEITQYYKTPCPNGDHDADVMYNFWVKELDCVSCGYTVPLFKDYRVAKGRYDEDDRYNVLCPNCSEVTLVDDWQSQSVCNECRHEFVPSDGNSARGDYNCPECGQMYSITDAIQEQGGYELRLYSIEYYCRHCDNSGKQRSVFKGYKKSKEADINLFEQAKQKLKDSSNLREYIPSESIPRGWKTSSPDFEGTAPGGGNLMIHDITAWEDMFNSRQLLCLAKLLRSIDSIENKNHRELLLMAFSDALNFNNSLTGYQAGMNKIQHLFKSNSFDPPQQPCEANVWGTEYGMGSFRKTFDLVKRGVEYAKSPTERYVKEGETQKSAQYNKSIGGNFTLHQGDMRQLEESGEFDAIITDPPYYDNVMYSELSDIFYVWQRILLKDEYDSFKPEKTPREESIVANPATEKGSEEFENELRQGFNNILDLLTDNGTLTFTYHHSGSESWGELLEALCDVGFEVTATYPISADLNKFFKGEAVSFDIVVVARPRGETIPASWNSLRRDIYRTARHTRKQLEENRDLSRGDIGVMEMGACFREYSKHHGKVQHQGEIMSAKEVVQKIYGIIQEASEIGIVDVFVDLLNSNNPSFDDVNKLCRGTSAKPKQLKQISLYQQKDGFKLGTWDNEKRQAYIQERANGDSDNNLSNLDKLQFLRYRYEKGQSVQNYVDKWGVDDDLRELAGRLADVTGDDSYTRVLGDRDVTSY